MTSHDDEMEMRYRRSWMGTVGGVVKKLNTTEWFAVAVILQVICFAVYHLLEVRELRQTIHQLESELNWLQLEKRMSHMQSGDTIVVPGGFYIPELHELQLELADARLSEAKLRERVALNEMHYEEDRIKVLKLFEAHQKHFSVIYQEIFKIRDQAKATTIR